MTARRFSSFIIMAAALLSAFAAFAFVAAPPAAATAAVAAVDHCPERDCPDHGPAMERGCCAGAPCVSAWLTPEGPTAAPSLGAPAVFTIPAGRLMDGVGAPPDPRPPRRCV